MPRRAAAYFPRAPHVTGVRAAPRSDDVLVCVDSIVGDGVFRHLRLNRPAARNALNTALLNALVAALEDIQTDSRVRAVLLTGEGPGFCAGGDLKEFRGVEDPRARMADRAGLLTTVLRQFAKLPVPTVGIGSGAALGAGAALLLACDAVVGVRDLVLGFPEIQDSVIPAVVMGAIVDRVPPRTALEMLTTGRRMGPEEAEVLGIVSSVADTVDRARTAAMRLIDAWGSVDPAALRRTKELYAEMCRLTRDEALERGREVTAATWSPPR